MRELASQNDFGRLVRELAAQNDFGRITREIAAQNDFGRLVREMAGRNDFQRLTRDLATRNDFQRLARDFTGRDRVLRISEQIQQPFSQDIFRRLREGLTPKIASQLAGASSLAAAAQILEQEAAQAGDLPDDEEGHASLGWWLATRPLVVQAALLYGALQVFDALSRLLEEASGEDIPDTLQAATTACFAITAFLLLWINERDKPDD